MQPWKKTEETPFKAGFRRMLNRVFTLPDGATSDFDIKHEGPAAAVLAITESGNVVLAKQFRPGPEEILLELPGGNIEPGENAMEGVQREFLEETGYAGEFEFVGTCLDCAYSTMKRYCYVAKNCKKIQEANLDDNEFIEVVEIPLQEFRELLRSGQMTDVEVGYLGLDHLNLL